MLYVRTDGHHSLYTRPRARPLSLPNSRGICVLEILALETRVMSTVTRIGNLEFTIMTILRDYPEARENDNLLCFLVWDLEVPNGGIHNLVYQAKAQIMKLTPAETITRIRRRLQNEKGVV